MSKPKVAIIMRTKNRCILLRRALQSVTGQRFQDWRLVLVNDGGAPEPVDALIREFDSLLQGRIQVHHNPDSIGMEAASNLGLRSSDSEMAVIHDDDDSWHPDFLSACVGYLDADPERMGVITRTYRLWERLTPEGPVLERKEIVNPWIKDLTLFRMAAYNTFPPISFVYRRAVLAEIGFYRESLPVLGDWEFNLRFMERYEVGLLDAFLANYHFRVDLSPEDAGYGNSFTHAVPLFFEHENALRNEALRSDLAESRFGMGFLLNVARTQNQIMQTLTKGNA